MTVRARHLSLRVPWHDTTWNGTICRNPGANCHCVELTNVAKNRDVAVEIRRAGQPFSGAGEGELPPCSDESGGFLSPNSWRIRHEHPYKHWNELAHSHGHLDATAWTVPAFTAHAVPFRWMSRRELESFVQPRLAEPLPTDTAPSIYTSDWVFQPHVQERILGSFFAPVHQDRSLAIFYTKSRQPIFDDVKRLVVGIGLVSGVAPTRYYESSDSSKAKHPIWQRDITHTLRPGGQGGLLIPFHDYLAPTGDLALDRERLRLAQDLRISPEPEHLAEFSFRAEHVSDDAAISVLTQALKVVSKIRQHGIAKGDWAATEIWLNAQLSAAWKLRGAFPGLGPVLEAAGLPMATSLVHLLDSADPAFARDPWRNVAAVLNDRISPPDARFKSEIRAFAKEWLALENNPKALQFAKDLSRIGLTVEQAKRWYSPGQRPTNAPMIIDNATIQRNPYIISEYDVQRDGSPAVGFSTIDRSVVGDGASALGASANDERRLRAALTAVLRDAEASGDTLLGIDPAREAASLLPVTVPVNVGPGWIHAHTDDLDGLINVNGSEEWIQLVSRATVAYGLRTKLAARAKRDAPVVTEDWRRLLEGTLRSKGGAFDTADERTSRALREQAVALGIITSRKLTVLVGRAGTGKTTVLGALSRSDQIGGPILFLAPTGKARVRLSNGVADHNSVRTVAQFLLSQGAYDPDRQLPKVLSKGTYDGHRTVVIDEASMLTEDTLLAVLSTFSTNVDRLILVGDPAQLPPIGPGRPFADLVAHLSGEITFDDEEDREDNVRLRQGAYARLTTEVRNVQGAASDTLRFAGMFSGDSLADAESIIGDLITDKPLNDLVVRYWNDEKDLHAALGAVMEETLGLSRGDTSAFNVSLGIEPDGTWPKVIDADQAETWQVLSPVRMNTWGVDELNRWVQGTWREKQLRSARRRGGNWTDPFGPKEIIRLDKVILTKNLKRKWAADRSAVDEELANGEIGLCKNDSRTFGKVSRGDVMDVAFAGRPETAFGFMRNEFGDAETGQGVLDLAYALTIHKAQGSDFGTVIVVLPSSTRLASRELIYTALTRSRRTLVLLIQGGDLAAVLRLRGPESSDTFARNTNLFRTSVRGGSNSRWAQHLIHRTSDGTMVRSKSELFIYESCDASGMNPSYELPLKSRNGDGTWKEPDFTFTDAAGDPIIWEHLGMLDDTAYAKGWANKKRWYAENGFVEGENLFTTTEIGGFDAAQVNAVMAKVKQLI